MTKAIGEMNGMYATLLKFALVAFPIFLSSSIGWSVWSTKKIHETDVWKERVQSLVDQGPRVLDNDLAKLRLQCQQDAVTEIEQRQGPLIAKIDAMQAMLNQVQRDVLRVQLILDSKKNERATY